MLILIFLLLTISEKCLSTSVISGGSYCTPSVQGSNYAIPDQTIIKLNCSVDNPNYLDNLLKWTIPSYDVEIRHLYGRPNDIDFRWPFKSTVISSDKSAKTTTASLWISAVSDLDGAVVECADVSNNIATCILQILSEL